MTCGLPRGYNALITESGRPGSDEFCGEFRGHVYLLVGLPFSTKGP